MTCTLEDVESEPQPGQASAVGRVAVIVHRRGYLASRAADSVEAFRVEATARG
jgi:hypothetical protein